MSKITSTLHTKARNSYFDTRYTHSVHVCFSVAFNRPFPSSLLRLFQNESSCNCFHMKMSWICIKINVAEKIIFYINGFLRRIVLTQTIKFSLLLFRIFSIHRLKNCF